MLSRTHILTFIIAVLISMINTSFIVDIFNTKRCPSPQLFTELKVQPFIGVWYNHLALPNLFEKGKCGRTTYYYDKTNTTLYNIDKELRGDKWVNSPLSTVTNDKPGVLNLHMFLVSAEFKVLYTDYTNYAIVYSCQNLYITDPYRFAWVLSRKPILTEEEKKEIYAKAEPLFKSAEIEFKELEPVLQDCPETK